MSSEVLEFLKDAGVQFVRVLWCDNANIIRGKAFHLNLFDEHWEHGIGISMAQQAIPALYDAVAPNSGLGPVGEVWLVPDWSTLRILPYAPTHARVMGNMIHQGHPWLFCPRHFLKRMIAAAKVEGLDVMAAFENEFYLLQQNPGDPVPADDTVFASTLAMDLNQEIIDAIAHALISQKIAVERYYPESGPGQHEISVRYTQALQAADQQIAFRETVRAIALRHNLKASFLPKIFADKAGNGCHLHLSLWRDGKNIVNSLHPTPHTPHPTPLSPTAQAFIAGILEHLPALMALTTPSSNSYRRIHPHFWSGAFRAWGWDNREAAVRVPSNPVPPSPTHFELKTVDASANPYLALGAVIAAGLDGIQRGLELGDPVTVDPGTLSEAERQAGRMDRLPTHLGEAIAHLSQDKILLDALGPDLAQAYLAVRRTEWEALKDAELSEEVSLLLDRY
ncbi:glutamine synthetase family protein [Kovacikia minuta CCNUW1]|uniref:glutamine synthetase family protein n=1 Tax=Kovacikia minuta TaxID=2931930 RepID=UPI001CCEF220|nr:glutamine synthetase family protein [Kovacikia minuta]UBF27506.1 glutamine synthetase family protein [Kovacikia minuta CCNUW1]